MLVVVLSLLTFRHALNRLHLVQVSHFHSSQSASENPSRSPFLSFVVHSGVELTSLLPETFKDKITGVHPYTRHGVHFLSQKVLEISSTHDDFFLSYQISFPFPSKSFPSLCLNFSYGGNPGNNHAVMP